MDGDRDLSDYRGPCRLFPLPGVVLFPHAVLPLHIFEPRYRQMTADALGSDGLIAIVQVRPDADWSGPEEPAIEPVACVGRILECRKLPDGRYNFLLQGLARVRIDRELDVPTLYRQAEVTALSDEQPTPAEELHRSELIAGARAVGRRGGGLDPELDALLDARQPLGVLTDLLSQYFGLPPMLKQALLAERRVDRRSQILRAIFREVTARGEPQDAPQRPFPPPFSVN